MTEHEHTQSPAFRVTSLGTRESDPLGAEAETLMPIASAIVDSARASTLIGRLRELCGQSFPFGHELVQELCRVFEYVEWRHIRSTDYLLKLFTKLPALVAGRQFIDYSALWPITLAADLHKLAEATVVLEPGLDNGSCDIFARPKAPEFNLRLSHLASPSERGLAVECKSVVGYPNLERRAKEAVDKIAKYGGGLVAIDISGIVSELAAHRASDPIATVGSVEFTHRHWHNRAREAVLKRWNRHGRGFPVVMLTHCRLSIRGPEVFVSTGHATIQYRRYLVETVMPPRFKSDDEEAQAHRAARTLRGLSGGRGFSLCVHAPANTQFMMPVGSAVCIVGHQSGMMVGTVDPPGAPLPPGWACPIEPRQMPLTIYFVINDLQHLRSNLSLGLEMFTGLDQETGKSDIVAVYQFGS